MNITKDITIRDLVANFPASVSYLTKYKINCIAGGEARWGTLEFNALKKNYNHDEIEKIVSELNVLYKERKVL